jgi:hypothetical protein
MLRVFTIQHSVVSMCFTRTKIYEIIIFQTTFFFCVFVTNFVWLYSVNCSKIGKLWIVKDLGGTYRCLVEIPLAIHLNKFYIIYIFFYIIFHFY